MGLDDNGKEHLIALYLVQEHLHGEYRSPKKQDTISHTTPCPEMAHDILLLVRRLESG